MSSNQTPPNADPTEQKLRALAEAFEISPARLDAMFWRRIAENLADGTNVEQIYSNTIDAIHDEQVNTDDGEQAVTDAVETELDASAAPYGTGIEGDTTTSLTADGPGSDHSTFRNRIEAVDDDEDDSDDELYGTGVEGGGV
jgi:hypothetical protein